MPSGQSMLAAGIVLVLLIQAPALAKADDAAAVQVDPAFKAGGAAAAAAATTATPKGLTLFTRLATKRTGGSTTPPVSVPKSTPYSSRFPKVAKLPEMKALSMQDISATYTGRRAPRAFGPNTRTATPQANGAAGASYSDSRFGEEYWQLAKGRVGTLFTRFTDASTGKTNWYICSASVINRALLLTAAHCVCDYGLGEACLPDVVDGQLQVVFDLGRDTDSLSIEGNWYAANIMVPAPYAYGTDTALVNGVVVNNDLALVWVYPGTDAVNNTQVGDVAGWNSYGTNGYGFSTPVPGYGIGTSPASVQLTQLGYPYAFDASSRMQIGNAATYNMQMWQKQNPRQVKNIVRGTSMSGGSSGGPWIANFGVDAVVKGIDYGLNADRNVVLGVTSWGYVDEGPTAPRMQGASFFGNNREYPGTYGTRGSGNIAKLMYDACDNPAIPAWNLKARGLCV